MYYHQISKVWELKNCYEFTETDVNRFRFFKYAAVIVALLCVLFMLATIGLAIALGVKMNQMSDVSSSQRN